MPLPKMNKNNPNAPMRGKSGGKKKMTAAAPKAKKGKRTRKTSAKAQAGSFPGYGGYSY